jgi:hypothetical protein
MNPKPVLERLIYGAVVILSLLALALVGAAATQFASIKLVYQGF